MAETKNHIEFEADFPDGPDWHAGGDPIGPGGRDLIGTVGEKLVAAGFKVSAPERHSWYGWYVLAARNGSRIWLMAQYPGPWLLMVDDWSGFLRKVFGRSQVELVAAIDCVTKALEADNRFRNIRLYSRPEYEQPTRR